MPDPIATDSRHQGVTIGLCIAGVTLGFLLGGFPGAFGAFIVAFGILSLRRARRHRHYMPKTECIFTVLHRDTEPVAAVLFAVESAEAEAVSERLLGRGWGVLEPPFDGPGAPVERIGVMLHGERGVTVHDLDAHGAPPVLAAARASDVPADWGHAVQATGYVLLLVDDARSVPGEAPAVGAYAMLHGRTAER